MGTLRLVLSLTDCLIGHSDIFGPWVHSICPEMASLGGGWWRRPYQSKWPFIWPFCLRNIWTGVERVVGYSNEIDTLQSLKRHLARQKVQVGHKFIWWAGTVPSGPESLVAVSAIEASQHLACHFPKTSIKNKSDSTKMQLQGCFALSTSCLIVTMPYLKCNSSCHNNT